MQIWDINQIIIVGVFTQQKNYLSELHFFLLSALCPQPYSCLTSRPVLLSMSFTLADKTLSWKIDGSASEWPQRQTSVQAQRQTMRCEREKRGGKLGISRDLVLSNRKSGQPKDRRKAYFSLLLSYCSLCHSAGLLLMLTRHVAAERRSCLKIKRWIDS